jgi:hypothetical protein
MTMAVSIGDMVRVAAGRGLVSGNRRNYLTQYYREVR